MAMQVAACPQVTVVDTADVPADVVEKERSIQMGKEDILKKPEQIRSVLQTILHSLGSVNGQVTKQYQIRLALHILCHNGRFQPCTVAMQLVPYGQRRHT